MSEKSVVDLDQFVKNVDFISGMLKEESAKGNDTVIEVSSQIWDGFADALKQVAAVEAKKREEELDAAWQDGYRYAGTVQDHIDSAKEN